MSAARIPRRDDRCATYDPPNKGTSRTSSLPRLIRTHRLHDANWGTMNTFLIRYPTGGRDAHVLTPSFFSVLNIMKHSNPNHPRRAETIPRGCRPTVSVDPWPALSSELLQCSLFLCSCLAAISRYMLSALLFLGWCVGSDAAVMIMATLSNDCTSWLTLRADGIEPNDEIPEFY